MKKKKDEKLISELLNKKNNRKLFSIFNQNNSKHEIKELEKIKKENKRYKND